MRPERSFRATAALPTAASSRLATAVLAPFRLTGLLGPLLRRSEDANIVTVSSGGMYTERFDLGRLEMPPHAYRGTTAYARAKRAQVVLSHEWARRWGAGRSGELCRPPGLGGHAGPGQRPALLRQTRSAPANSGRRSGYGRLARRRRGAPPGPGPPLTEGFFHDRRRRGEHRLPWTARAVAPEDGRLLWEWCVSRTGAADAPGVQPRRRRPPPPPRRVRAPRAPSPSPCRRRRTGSRPRCRRRAAAVRGSASPKCARPRHPRGARCPPPHR